MRLNLSKKTWRIATIHAVFFFFPMMLFCRSDPKDIDPDDGDQGDCPTPLDETTVSVLSIASPGDLGVFSVLPGTKMAAQLGILECCYFYSHPEVCVAWSVDPPDDGASIDAATGDLSIDNAAPHGNSYAIRANIEEGRRFVEAHAYVYTPEGNPMAGHWAENAQIDCDTNEELTPADPFGSLWMRADGGFWLTWTPFELSWDYIGTYSVDPLAGTIVFTFDTYWGSPPNADTVGTFERQGDTLFLRDIWLGGTTADPPNCGHRLQWFADP